MSSTFCAVRVWPLAIIAAALLSSQANAQPATTVQLPTFSFFGVSTTVSVPDSGDAFLGGINRSSSGSASRGLPGLGGAPIPGRLGTNAAIGQSTSGGGMHVTATIHDLQAMDEAILGQGGAGNVQPDRLSQRLHSAQPTTASEVGVADILARQKAHAEESRDELQKFYERGQTAETAGKTSLARVYYQMVARRAAGDLHDQAVAAIARVATPASNSTASNTTASHPADGRR